MIFSTINFDTWCKNHPKDHDAKWCRELYPWEVFKRINYQNSVLDAQQKINVDNLLYVATLKKRFIAEDERIHYLIRLCSTPSSNSQQWSQRTWNDLFHLVFDPSGYFITLFTEKKDPSKVVLRKFLTSRFKDIELVRSLPISGLLFRSIISYVARDKYDGLEQYKPFTLHTLNGKKLNTHINNQKSDIIEPFLSKGRKLWITYSFTEEKAHRQALRLMGQAKELFVIFCHPTFTRHHRCVDQSTNIVSLPEFLRTLSPDIHRRYIQQSRFLINHLRLEDDGSCDIPTSDEIIETTKSLQQPIPIHTSHLREAKAGLGMIVSTTGDVAYICACANLLNSAMRKNSDTYSGSIKLTKEVYNFKSILGRFIEEIICNPLSDVDIFIERKGAVYITVKGLQFSFHAIPRTPRIETYENSQENIQQDWAGVKLQLAAPLVLKWARGILLKEN